MWIIEKQEEISETFERLILFFFTFQQSKKTYIVILFTLFPSEWNDVIIKGIHLCVGSRFSYCVPRAREFLMELVQ